MTLSTHNDKQVLETNYTTGNKAWAARITGLDPKWKFQREFLNGTRKGLQITPVAEGDIIEEVIYSHSGKNRDNYYYRIENGEMVKVSERDVILHFS